MTENATPHDFTPRDALNALAEARRYEEPLRQRTEGLTWIIWALATPGIFASYHAVGATFGTNAWPWWTPLVWVPWVAVGITATLTLWSAAALAAPALEEDEEQGWRVGLVWFLVISAAWAVTAFGPWALNGPIIWVLAVGTAWTLLGTLNPYKASRTGRRVGTSVGALFLAVGLVLTATGLTVATTSAIAVIASGFIPFAGGLWQTRRG